MRARSPRNPREAAVLQDELVSRLATARLEPFVELAWRILEPGTPFKSNWHISLICEYLEAVTAGEIQNLVVNVPPRYGKSLLVTVLWPVWEWIQHPSQRWLFVSYSEALALRHSLDRRRVLQDEWYRQRFPHVRLAADQSAKAEFHNTRRGVMTSTSMGGSITGKGGDRMVIDDPHSPEQVESDLQREHVIDRFRMTLSTRLDDKRRAAMIVVMQRLHTQDLSGFCVDLGFHHLRLPALAEKRTLITFPRSKQTIERQPDEPLWPERENHVELERLRQTLGSYAFAGQYQQNPVPRSGGMFPPEWWRYYDELPLGKRVQYIQSWDLTFKEGEGSNYVVGLVAARIDQLVFLIDRFKKKVSFVDTLSAIQDMRTRYPQTQVTLIEEAANGAAVVDVLKSKIPGLIAIAPEGGKTARAHAVQAQIEAGQVHLPSSHTPGGELRTDRAWVDDFVTVCGAFPKGSSDDDVDALTQMLVWVHQHPHVEPCGMVRNPEPMVRFRYDLFGRMRRLYANRGRRVERRASSWLNHTTLGGVIDDASSPDEPDTRDPDSLD